MIILDLKTGAPVALSASDTLACAVGNFDGVHLGHRALLRAAAEKPNGATKSAVWTFRTPCSSLLCPDVKLLTAPDERLALFRTCGIELAILEAFDEVRDLTPDAFCETLFDACHVRTAICGFDFRYGKNASGTPQTLAAFFAAHGGFSEIIPPVEYEKTVVSASEIRRAIADGEMKRATALLGRAYALTGDVAHGNAIGRTLGVPTANLLFPPDRALPKFGAYAVRVHAGERSYFAVADVGVHPTVKKGGTNVVCEAHLFDFDGDLYGQTVRVEFLKFLRPEQAFSDEAALRSAIREDIENAKAFFAKTGGGA